MSEAVLRASGICKDYRDGDAVHRVLHALDVTVERGEFVAVMGPSGCGKTTLLNVLGLLTAPTEADRLEMEGLDCLRLSDRARGTVRRDRIGFVFQRFNLLPTISAEDNIRLALRLKGMEVDGQVDGLLEDVGIRGVAHRKPGHLSIGEQQRAAIARAMAPNPALLLADEPTGNLDSENSQNVLGLFRRFHQSRGTSILMITHSAECASAADRVLHMKDGRFV